VVRLFAHDHARDAFEQGQHDRGRQALQPKGAQLVAAHVGGIGVEVGIELLVVGAHVHVGPAGHGARSQHEAGDDLRRALHRLGPRHLEAQTTTLQLAHLALGEVELAHDLGRLGLVVGLLARTDLAHRDGAIDQTVGP
jgi:hypothetical protein